LPAEAQRDDIGDDNVGDGGDASSSNALEAAPSDERWVVLSNGREK